MFEYAFNAKAEAEMVRGAVEASLDSGIVSADIASGNIAFSTSDIGDWIADYISKGR